MFVDQARISIKQATAAMVQFLSIGKSTWRQADRTAATAEKAATWSFR